jgi:hypothetical protein
MATLVQASQGEGESIGRVIQEGGPRMEEVMRLMVVLDETAFGILYKAVEGEEPTDRSRRFFALWLEEQQVLSDEFKRKADAAVKTAEELKAALEMEKEAVEKAGGEKEKADGEEEGGTYWDKRVAFRKKMEGKRLRKDAREGEQAGVRVRKASTEAGAVYELQEAVDLREGFLSVVTPAKGAEMSVQDVAKALGMDPGELCRINAKVYGSITKTRKLRNNTMLWLEDSDEEEESDDDEDEVASIHPPPPVIAPDRPTKKKKTGESSLESAREAVRHLAALDGEFADALPLSVKERLGLGAGGSAPPVSSGSSKRSAPSASVMPTQEKARMDEGVANTAAKIGRDGVGTDSGNDFLPPASYLLPYNQPIETRLSIIERNRPLPDFETPEALFGAINKVLRYDKNLTPEQIHQAEVTNDTRMHAMRAKIAAAGLSKEETKDLMKQTVVDMMTGDVGEDKHMKAFGEHLKTAHKRKLKEEKATKEKAQKDEDKAVRRRLEELLGKADLSGKMSAGGGRGQAHEGGYKGGRGGGYKGGRGGAEGGKGGKAWNWVPWEARSCYVCGESGHMQYQCPHWGAKKESEGEGK